MNENHAIILHRLKNASAGSELGDALKSILEGIAALDGLRPVETIHHRERPSTIRRIHSIPIGDTDEYGKDVLHSAQSDCWCHPLNPQDGLNLFIHHAQDLREVQERMTGKHVSAGWVNIAEYVDDPSNAGVERRERSGQ